MGEARDGGLAVQGDLEAVPPVEPLSALTAQLDDSPLARIARAEMLRSNAAVSLERARRIPDVTISAGVKRVTTGGVPDNQAVVGVSIPIPLFNTNKGALLEATHKAARANADLDRERTRLRLDLTQAYANFEAAAQEAQRLKADILPAARLALDAMSRGYGSGSSASSTCSTRSARCSRASRNTCVRSPMPIRPAPTSAGSSVRRSHRLHRSRNSATDASLPEGSPCHATES